MFHVIIDILLFFFVDNHAAAETKMVVFVVHYAVLPGGDSLYFVVRFDTVQVTDATDVAVREVRRMADLERDFFLVREVSPWVFGDKVEAMHIDCLAVLRFRIVTVGDVDDIPLDVLFDDKPGTAAQTQSFALPDGVEQ